MNKPSTLVPMRSTAVNFSHGMIVNETDLTAAMQYPVQLMQAVNRAVYGCGVVCGFWFDPDPDLCGATRTCDPCPDGSDNTPDTGMAYPGFRLQVSRGTAIDCFGMPIELCEPAFVDVTPELCGCKGEDTVVCIAIRRTSAGEAPRGDCCSDSGGTDCTRRRDHVELKAFPTDKWPEHICAHLPEGKGKPGCGYSGGQSGDYESAAASPDSSTRPGTDRDEREEICGCLMKCDPCDCCGEGWVMLGCVTVCKTGIRVENFPQPREDGSRGGYPKRPYLPRKFIKMIECLCGDMHHDPQNLTVTGEQRAQAVMELTEKLTLLELTDRQMETSLALARVSAPEEIVTLYRETPEAVANLVNLKADDTRLGRLVEILADRRLPELRAPGEKS